MKLIGVLVQSIIFVFVINIALSAYATAVTLSLSQISIFIPLALSTSLITSIIFRRLNRFVRTLLAAIVASIIVGYYFSFFEHIDLPWIQTVLVMFASYLVSVMITKIVIGSRYDDATNEMTVMNSQWHLS